MISEELNSEGSSSLKSDLNSDERFEQAEKLIKKHHEKSR